MNLEVTFEMKTVYVVIGVLLILAGILLSFGIVISSVKEGDESGYIGLLISFAMIGFGIYNLIRNRRRH
ncbi:MAG: hypothetical protein U0X76_08125 [Bacteroidia bacterium]